MVLRGRIKNLFKLVEINVSEEELITRLHNIFELGAHYNAALFLYRENMRSIFALEAILNSEFEALYRQRLIFLIDSYLNEHNPRRAQLHLDRLKNESESDLICHLAAFSKKELKLCWPLRYFFFETRLRLSPLHLLSKHFEANRLTEGFVNFNEESLRPILCELADLELMRKRNYFIDNRVSVDGPDRLGNLILYYDKKNTSFRQALLYSIINLDQSSTRRLPNAPGTRSLKQFGGIFIALDYQIRNNEEPLTKANYFAALMEENPELTEYIEDIRVIDRGANFIKKLNYSIEKLYERNECDLEREAQRVQPEYALPPSADPQTQLASTLSIFIDFYSFMLANVTFFRRLDFLRKSIAEELKGSGDSGVQLSTTVTLLLNNINYEKNFGILSDDRFEDIKNIFSSELKILRDTCFSTSFWGLLSSEDCIPPLSAVIKSLASLKKAIGANLNQISHDDLKQVSDTLDIKKALIFKKLIPTQKRYIAAGFGLHEYGATITNNGSGGEPVERLMAALDFFDKTAFNSYLSWNVIARKINTLEEMLWGLFYFHTIEFKEKKVTVEKCIEIIGELYDTSLDDKRFRNGKNNAKIYIQKYAPNPSFNT